jgi:hypothetical protein
MNINFDIEKLLSISKLLIELILFIAHLQDSAHMNVKLVLVHYSEFGSLEAVDFNFLQPLEKSAR